MLSNILMTFSLVSLSSTALVKLIATAFTISYSRCHVESLFFDGHACLINRQLAQTTVPQNSFAIPKQVAFGGKTGRLGSDATSPDSQILCKFTFMRRACFDGSSPVNGSMSHKQGSPPPSRKF